MSDPIDPLTERRLRLEQAEREAKGDFSRPAPTTAAVSAAAPAGKKKDNDWAKYKGGNTRDNENDDDDDGNPNAMLNKQHNSLRAQAKITLGMAAMLDTTTQAREER